MTIKSKEWAVAVLRGGHAPCENCPLCPPNETGCKVARLHDSCIHSVAAGVKLHHSLNHALCYPDTLTPKCRCGHPDGHPKLLQLETPLRMGWTERHTDGLTECSALCSLLGRVASGVFRMCERRGIGVWGTEAPSGVQGQSPGTKSPRS